MNFKYAIAASALIAASAVSAAPVSPAFDSFGTLAGATFGGSGIPNTAVAITTDGGLTLGLTAHQRFVGPNLVNDGAGRFSANTGVSQTSPSPGNPYATWNVGLYIAGTNLSAYTFTFLYDYNPDANTEESAHGSIVIPGTAIPTGYQDSWNLGMNFLETFATFDPLAGGEYTFALTASTGASTNLSEVARAAILVNAVPEPTSLALVGLALASVAVAGLRRRKA